MLIIVRTFLARCNERSWIALLAFTPCKRPLPCELPNPETTLMRKVRANIPYK